MAGEHETSPQELTPLDMERILAGEREGDLSPAEEEAFMAFLETERGRELLAQAERELDPIAEAFQPEQPSADAWARVDEALEDELAHGGGVVVTPPAAPANSNWGATFLLAAALLFAAGLGMLVVGPGKPKEGGGLTSHADPNGKPGSMRPAPLAAQPTEPVEVIRPAAEALELVAGEGYEVTQETQDGSLLIVVVKEKAEDEGH